MEIGLHGEGPSEVHREGRFDPLIPKAALPLIALAPCDGAVDSPIAVL